MVQTMDHPSLRFAFETEVFVSSSLVTSHKLELKPPSRKEQLKAAAARQSNSTLNSQQPTSQATQQQCGSDSLNSQQPPQPTQEEPTSQSSGPAASHAQPSTRRTSTRRARGGVSGFGIRVETERYYLHLHDSLNMEESNQEELRIDEKSFDLIPSNIFNIPKDILEGLCDRLSISDQLQFARVCKSCHSLVFERRNPKAHEILSLVGLTEDPDFCGKRIQKQITCYQIHRKSFQHSNPFIIGSFKGWLFLQYHKEKLIQLVNLFSNIHLDLPPLNAVKLIPSDGHVKFVRAFAVLFCICMRPVLTAVVSNYGKLLLCKIGGNAWEAHETDEQYVNVAFYKKKLYAMRKNYNKVDIFEIDHDLKRIPVGGIEIDDALKLFPLAVIGSSQLIDAPSNFQAYLVVDSQEDNLFLVMHHCKEVKVHFLTFEFEVYKVSGNRFVKVYTLGDQIVLLNGSCSEMIDVKDCPPSFYFHGNQICFKKNLKNLGIYSFKDGIVNWLPQFRAFDCIHWMIPRLAGKCYCESHIIP
ncbi:hypothetical protein K1719_036867 [Acacia pycnantha]|nr:hypothetical protein K1719_036867 [Acacia pycnantha]